MADDVSQDQDEVRQNRTICGPRCVHYVLQHFGHDDALISVIREMQWPDLLKGSTVQQVADVLQSHNVYTRVIQLRDVGCLRVKRPAIVHLDNHDAHTKEKMGHYIVVMPDVSSRDAVVWDGVFGMRRQPWADVVAKMSGIVILTSDSPIEDVDDVMTLHPLPHTWGRYLFSFVCVGAAFLIPRALYVSCKRGAWSRILCWRVL